MNNNLIESLKSALEIDGTLGVALGDWNTGFSLGQVSANHAFSEAKLETAIALNSDVIKAKNKAREALGFEGSIEDILISLHDQYHLICMCDTIPSGFFYLAMERAKANLALAQIKLRIIEQKLEL